MDRIHIRGIHRDFLKGNFFSIELRSKIPGEEAKNVIVLHFVFHEISRSKRKFRTAEWTLVDICSQDRLSGGCSETAQQDVVSFRASILHHLNENNSFTPYSGGSSGGSVLPSMCVPGAYRGGAYCQPCVSPERLVSIRLE